MRKITLEEVSTPGCAHCAAFKEFWDVEKANWPNVEFRELSIEGAEGKKMAAEKGMFSSPGIVINGELFWTGAVDTDLLVAKLKELSQ